MTHKNISNKLTRDYMRDAELLTPAEKLSGFMQTPNGQFTQRVLDALGMKADSVQFIKVLGSDGDDAIIHVSRIQNG